jgi:uncharacterized protein (TIRG00374 family)
VQRAETPYVADRVAAGKPPAGSGLRRRWIAAFAVLAVAAGLAVWTVLSGVAWEARWVEFQAAFREVSWAWLSLAAVLVLLTYVGRALRWAAMMHPVKARPSFWNILKATCIGFTAIVLFGRAGELVRPYFIAVREGVPVSSQVAAWLLERVLDLMMVLLIFGLALTGMSGHALGSGALAKVVQAGGTLIALAGVACIAFVLAFRYFSDAMQRRIDALLEVMPERFAGRGRELIGAFVTGMGATRTGSVAMRVFLYTLAEWMLITAMFAAILRAFPATAGLGIADVVVALGIIAIGSAVQLPGVGGGMQVATVIVLTELFHVALGNATGIALIIWAVSFLLIVPFGVVLALREGLSIRKLAHMSEKQSQAVGK